MARQLIAPHGAVAELLAEEHANQPFAATGERIIPQPTESPPPPPPPSIRELMQADGPPDWRAEAARARGERPAPDPTEELPGKRPPPRRESAVSGWNATQMRPGPRQ